MRFAIVVLMAAGLLIGSAAIPVTAVAGTADSSMSAADAQQQPTARLEVDVDTDEGGAWYTSPIWIAIGIIALVLLVLLIVMATRGGTTIVRD